MVRSQTGEGTNPNGNWTLFLADLSRGEPSTLAGWSLDITAELPEPVNVALGVFAGFFVVVPLGRSKPVRHRVTRRRIAAGRGLEAV